jgi:RNA-directed DNA polymerase
MKESYRKGVANHPDPESCGVDREGGAEALTGARAGEVSSREINVPGTPTPLVAAEGNTGRDAIASSSRVRRGRRPSACTETPRTGTGRSQGPPWTDGTVERAGKAGGRTPAMHDPGKSDGPIVPKKQTNKAAPWATESAEGRGPAKGNSPETDTFRTQSRIDVPSGLERVRLAARTAVCRHYSRQEPGALSVPAGICAGGPGQPGSLPRPLRQALEAPAGCPGIPSPWGTTGYSWDPA